MKLRILFVTDATYLSTGYSVYAREIMRRLHNNPNFELAELALYAGKNESRIKDIPWKVIPNLFDNDEEKQIYDSHPVNPFGAWKFESTCLDFKPHVVFCHLDTWMSNYQISSPYRPYYHLIQMPAVDAVPQAAQWISDYSRCDAISTYTDWAIDVLHGQSGGKINIIGNTSPAADDNFKPVSNKIEHKKIYGLENYKVIGTVMRNQKRKLFPDLFQVFRKLLDNSGRDDLVLYCHTGYPDRNPWNIPELLNEYGLTNKVLFTYRCNTSQSRGGCGYVTPGFFSDFIKVCPRCNKLNLTTADVHNGVNNTELASIYNLFDVYVQYAALEACGMPQIEAAACGIPIMSIDYSGMGEIVRKLHGTPLPPLSFTKESETGRLFAIPDNDWTANKLEEFLDKSYRDWAFFSETTRQAYLANYSYDKSAAVFNSYLTQLDVDKQEKLWYSPARVKEPAPFPQNHENISHLKFTKWLVSEVMGEPSLIGSYFHARLLKDSMYGCSTQGVGGSYLNENSFLFGDTNLNPFSREQAYELCANYAKNRNVWEQRRKMVIK